MSDETIGSFSFDVTRRMLRILQEHGPLKKTNLAQKTGLNYSVCMRYVEMLTAIGWLEVHSSDAYRISITEVGKQVSSKLLDMSTGASASVKDRQVEDVRKKEPRISVLQEEKAKRPLQVSPTGKHYNIMIVDDEPDILITYQYFLSPHGYNVRTFSDPYSALHEFALRPKSYFDLVILDIRMPKINGLQLYQSFKAINPLCKIAFISALDAAKEMISILPGAASVDIIKKPVNEESFLKRIEELLNQR